MAKGDNAGRKKGIPNKATIEFKEAVNNLISFATPKMVNWLESVAEDDPAKALDHVYKFAQFGYPLLSRADTNTTISGAINANVTGAIEIVHVKPSGGDTSQDS